MFFECLIPRLISYVIVDPPTSPDVIRRSDEIISKGENPIEMDNPDEKDVKMQHDVKAPEEKSDSIETVGHGQLIHALKGTYDCKFVYCF